MGVSKNWFWAPHIMYKPSILGGFPHPYFWVDTPIGTLHTSGLFWSVENSTWDLGASSKCSVTPGEDVSDSDRLSFSM